MLLKVRVTDTASLLKLTERVRKIPGIEQTHTTIVLESQFERSIYRFLRMIRRVKCVGSSGPPDLLTCASIGPG
jgi:hypothetical protein